MEHLLLLDDDDTFRDRLARSLARRGLRVTGVATADAALRVAHEDPPDRAVVDLRLEGGPSGLEVLRDLKAHLPELRAVVLTGWGSIPTAVDAVRLGAVGYVSKPADADDVLGAFARGDRPPLEGSEAAEAAWERPSLARTEWEQIQQVLAEAGGNISAAARRLGLHRRTLQRKLQKHPPRA